jgi:hypothetical protein
MKTKNSSVWKTQTQKIITHNQNGENCHVLSYIVMSCPCAFSSIRFPLLVLLGSFPLSIPLSLYVPFLLPAVPHSPNDLVYSFTPVPYFAL